MAQLLEPGAQKLIGSKKVVSQNGNSFVYEITVNGAVQKDAYERLFQARNKDTEIKGFRKGEAPRNLVEQQIYSEVVKDLTNLMINYSVEELLTDEQIIATVTPEVEKVNFTMVETPLSFTLKIEKLPDYKLPDVSKFKVEAPKFEVKSEEIETARKNLWEEWQKKAKDEEKKEFPEISDAWVEKQMKIPNIKSIVDLDKLLHEELEHAKLHQEEDNLVNGALSKAIESMKIEVPVGVVEGSLKRNMEAQEEQFKKYGITFQDYLKHYNKTEDEYKKEVSEQAEKRFREDVFWTLFIKARGVKIDPKDPKDIVFINYAASSMRVKPDDKLSQRQVEVVLQTAAMYKAVQVFREEIGLKGHEEPEIKV
jgi:trigger factor